MSQSRSPDTVTASPSGEAATVELPRPFGHAWKDGPELSLFAWPPDGALLIRQSARATGVIAASVDALSVDELFGLVLSGVRTGKLVYARANVRKTVSFRDGQVIFATSTEPWERLGSAVVSMRLATRAQVQEALHEVGPGVRLGQVLTRTGLLTAARLYAAMAELVREIVLNLFCEREGQLLFLEGAPPPEDVLKLPEPTRDLALFGVQRSEELLRLRRMFPHELFVAAGSSAPQTPEAKALVERAGSGIELRELRASFDGGAHAFWRLVARLLDTGVLVKRTKTRETTPAVTSAAPTPSALSVVERYDEMVKTICAALGEAGRGLEDLRSFLADPLPGMEDALAGVTLSDDGVLDSARVLSNVEASDAAGRARAYEVLDAFLSYALFSARNVVPPEVAEALSRQARRLKEGT